ncbi:MAG: hypothetical protein ABIN67_10120 [Ferruginibacter sp.]
MRKENIKSLLVGIPFFILIFGGSYFWRQYRDKDITGNSKYVIGYITKKTGSLTSGEQWHYEFKYHNTLYKAYRSTHVDYNVHLGDCFLVNFSSKDPNHCKILYQYKLNGNNLNYMDSVWDTIPKSLLRNSFKTE